MKMLSPLLVLAAAVATPHFCQAKTERWTEAEANAWSAAQPWLVGSDYIPASAINQLEMWQPPTFAPQEIDRELGWAQQLGMNTMRVFLHDLAWKSDREGFLKRVDQFLAIAAKHGIKPLFVLLDDCWNPDPKIGRQPVPRPGVHNSGWLQSPGRKILARETSWDTEVKPYVQAVIGRFRDDPRVLAWDLYNEPGNGNGGSYGSLEPKNKEKLSTALLGKVFAWAREADPSQPLTAGIWDSSKFDADHFDALNRLISGQSDVISFHTYSPPEGARKLSETLMRFHRPLFCTEYMARPNGSTFQGILPWFKEKRIAAYNWGFVEGKTGTIHAWNTWGKPDKGEPGLWFHDVLRPNGTPYKQEEVDLIKKLTGVAP